jgi:hypothetical protein
MEILAPPFARRGVPGPFTQMPEWTTSTTPVGLAAHAAFAGRIGKCRADCRHDHQDTFPGDGDVALLSLSDEHLPSTRDPESAESRALRARFRPVRAARASVGRACSGRQARSVTRLLAAAVLDHALALEDAGEDPDRWLLIGPDTAGNLLEVVVMITAEGTQVTIHAMPMRDKYRRLLGP